MRRAALALAFVLAASPASPHCYSVWHYPTPQHCGGVYARAPRTWYVEITKPPPVEKDERSPQDIADQAEHDKAVADHHSEINIQLMILHAKEMEGLQ